MAKAPLEDVFSLSTSFRVNNFISPLTAEEEKENQLKGNLTMSVLDRPQEVWKMKQDRETGKQDHGLFISVSRQLLLQFHPWERISEIIKDEHREEEQQNTNK